MKTEFKILTIEEEQKLNKKELKEYYINLRNYLAERKLTNTSFGATTICPRLNSITTKFTEGTIKNIKVTCEGKENIPSERVIFAHFCDKQLDKFILINQNDRHCLLVDTKETNKLLSLQQIVNGMIIVTNENEYAKLDMIRVLLEGYSISYFINNESLINAYENPSNSFIDIAKKAGVPIVPVVHDIKHKDNKITKIHTIYEEPIYVSENDNLLEKLEEYINIISPISIELIEIEKNIKTRVLSK